MARRILRNRSKSGVIQIMVAAGITIVILGLFWLVATAPVSSIIALYDKGAITVESDITGTVVFIRIFISVLPLLIGLGVTAWGWVKTVEERETGFSSF
jgi:hypothetical protein